MSRANAASIAKTAVGHLAATARESFASANNDLIKGKQWLSTLDNRTTPQCRIRDRLKYTLDNKPVGLVCLICMGRENSFLLPLNGNVHSEISEGTGY